MEESRADATAAAAPSSGMGIALSRPIEEDLVARGADGANAYVGPACHVDAIAATAICDIIVVRRCRRVAIITKVVGGRYKHCALCFCCPLGLDVMEKI